MRRLAVTSLLGLTCVVQAQAHRLDEYLQATRIGIEPDRIEVEIDLTPGVAVAARVFWLIDSDRDGKISDTEARAYARRVLGATKLQLDGHDRPLQLIDVIVPPPDAMAEGLGSIRVRALASAPILLPGAHHLGFQNAHEAGLSVYLVNALLPTNPGIQVMKQTRDELQRDYQLDFAVSGRVSPRRRILLLSAAVVAVLLASAACAGPLNRN